MSPRLNVSTEARAMVGLAQQPSPAGTLTTADIASFAEGCLLRISGDGDRLLAEATANSGKELALHCSSRISSRIDEASRISILAFLATRHGDDSTAAKIEADIDATRRNLVRQARAAYLLSIPKVLSCPAS